MSARARRRVGVLLLAALWLASAGGLAWKWGEMRPVHAGTADMFWWLALSLDEDRPGHPYMGAIYAPRDGVFVYTIQSLHDEGMYSVSAWEVDASLAPVVMRLDCAVAGGSCPGYVAEGFARWKAGGGRVQADAAGLVAQIRAAQLAALAKHDVEAYSRSVWDESRFEGRWARARRYWLNGVLEFAFFAALTAFAVGPWSRVANEWTLALRAGLTPFLFFLPYFLGYADWTFTTRGPSGGILYPHLLRHFGGLHGWCGEDEQVLLEVFPPWLEKLSQPGGQFLIISGRGYVGPITVVLLGAGLALGVLLVAAVLRKRPSDGLRRATLVGG